MLDGVFAFLLYDTNRQRIFVSRDIYGVRPLFLKILSYIHHYIREPVYLFASELKSISILVNLILILINLNPVVT